MLTLPLHPTYTSYCWFWKFVGRCIQQTVFKNTPTSIDYLAYFSFKRKEERKKQYWAHKIAFFSFGRLSSRKCAITVNYCAMLTKQKEKKEAEIKKWKRRRKITAIQKLNHHKQIIIMKCCGGNGRIKTRKHNAASEIWHLSGLMWVFYFLW